MLKYVIIGMNIIVLAFNNDNGMVTSDFFKPSSFTPVHDFVFEQMSSGKDFENVCFTVS